MCLNGQHRANPPIRWTTDVLSGPAKVATQTEQKVSSVKRVPAAQSAASSSTKSVSSSRSKPMPFFHESVKLQRPTAAGSYYAIILFGFILNPVLTGFCFYVTLKCIQLLKKYRNRSLSKTNATTMDLLSILPTSLSSRRQTDNQEVNESSSKESRWEIPKIKSMFVKTRDGINLRCHLVPGKGNETMLMAGTRQQ